MPEEKPKWEPVWWTKIKCETGRIYHPHKNVWNTHWKETSRNPWKCFEGEWLTITLKAKFSFYFLLFKKVLKIHKLYFALSGGAWDNFLLPAPSNASEQTAYSLHLWLGPWRVMLSIPSWALFCNPSSVKSKRAARGWCCLLFSCLDRP